MKKLIIITSTVFICLISMSLQLPESGTQAEFSKPDGELSMNFPENIISILERSCFDCHSNSAKNFMSKGKLNFSEWDNYDKKKKINKLDKICEDVKDGSMPKKKYKKKHPEAVLSEEDINLICSWVEEESNKILGD